MKTTLHYQVKDFKRFVLDNIEKRGYILAAGTEPMMANMDDMDDPEQVVMEVLVEDRPDIDFQHVEITSVPPVALLTPALAEVTEEEPAVIEKPRPDKTEEQKAEEKRQYQREWLRKKKAGKLAADQNQPVPGITEEQLEKQREYKREWTAKKRADQAHAREVIAQAKAKAKQLPQETDAEPDPPGFLSSLDAQFQREILGEIEMLNRGQEVVAPAPLPFQYEEAEDLARAAGA